MITIRRIARIATTLACAGAIAAAIAIPLHASGSSLPAPSAAVTPELDMFLKVDGIEGESQDSRHKNEITLHGFSFNVTQVGTRAAGGGGGAGKAEFGDLTVIIVTSKASPKLFLATATGDHIKNAIVTVRKPGRADQDFLTITVTDLLVSGYEVLGGEDTSPAAPIRATSFLNPVERVKFNYAKIEMEYKEQKPDGSLGGPVKAGYDIKQNKSV